MASVWKCIQFAPVLAALACLALSAAVHFYPDDPLTREPAPRAVHNVHPQEIDDFADFVIQSVRMKPRPPVVSLAVNTLGDVLDSEWYNHRHPFHRMSAAELRRGPGTDRPPIPPFTVAGAKTQGITPGFRMRDVHGRLYFLKPDPKSNPEMASAADVIGSKFFYALGYFTPEDYIVELRPEDLSIASDAKITGASGKPRQMDRRDLDEIFDMVPRSSAGNYRFLASLKADGNTIGPFRYEGTRSDDPNDTVPHERRRDLRGLSVFCAWLNHTDTKAANSLDTVIERNGIPVIRHYLIDFGSILGSDSDMPKNPRFGHEFIIPPGRDAGKDIVALGLNVKPWEKARFHDIPAVGNFEADTFVPENWHSNYPNPAFLSALPGDLFWAAKQVMAFSDEDIRTIVEAGQFSDPRAVLYLTKTLAARRDRIGRAYLTKGLPLDDFRIADQHLEFNDLAAKHGFAPPIRVRIQWSKFDNTSGTSAPLSSPADSSLPAELMQGRAEVYYCATLTGADGSRNEARVDVYLRGGAAGAKVVGIERHW